MKNTSIEAAVVEPPATPVSGRPRRQPWREALDNRWLVLGTLFFVTAALGLPVLWMSRAFSLRWKVALTFAVLAWTALVFWVFLIIMAWCYGQIAEALGWQMG